MAHNTRKLVGVILMLSLLVAALAAFTITASAAEKTASVIISDYANTNGWTDATKYSEVKVDSNIAVTVSGTDANTGKYYVSGKDWRIYQTGTPSIVVSGADGVTISSVKITYNVNKGGTLTHNGSNISSGTAVTVNANSITFGVGNTGTATNGQVRITQIEVTYSGGAAACAHTNTTAIGEAESATCVKNGITAGLKCADCDAVINAQEIIPATGEHNYVDGVCSMCEAVKPAAGQNTTVSVTIATYADTNSWANGTKYTTVKMDSNITVTVSGTDTNTGKYYTSGEDWRIYQTGTPSIVVSGADGVTISSVKITYKISNTGTLTHNSSNIASETAVTVNANSITFGVGNTGTATNGQVKITAIEVVYTIGGDSSCTHENTTTETVEATCTTNGSVTVTCDDCKEVLSTEEIAATGHSYDTVEVVVVEDVPFVLYKCACGGDEKVKNVATFRGASIRYKDGASVEQLAVRFGYQFDLNIIEYIVGWSWDYEAIDGNAVISGTVDGTAITAAGVSNLVFTDIPTKRIDGTFKVTLTLVLEIDGAEYTYTEAEPNVRIIYEVLTAIKDDTTETQEARDYAQTVLDAFAKLPDDDEPAVMPSNEENEN